MLHVLLFLLTLFHKRKCYNNLTSPQTIKHNLSTSLFSPTPLPSLNQLAVRNNIFERPFVSLTACFGLRSCSPMKLYLWQFMLHYFTSTVPPPARLTPSYPLPVTPCSPLADGHTYSNAAWTPHRNSRLDVTKYMSELSFYWGLSLLPLTV